jgi:toxin ParE1/3/4
VLPLKIRPKARYDLAYIAAWISLDNPKASLAFQAAVEQEVELLRHHPFLGRLRFFRTPGLRSWRVSHFEKYLIFYVPTDRGLEVVRVLHGAQDLQRILGKEK